MQICEARFSTVSLVVVFVLGCVMFAGVGATAQTLHSKDQLDQLKYSVKGQDMFRTYCAPCHGSDAKGTGPVAPALKIEVPDLTIMARNNRSQFPVARVRDIVMGDEVMASHGSRDMPIWGPVFHEIEKEQGLPKNAKLENLLQCLESIQQR